jgi:hypothetical protein
MPRGRPPLLEGCKAEQNLQGVSILQGEQMRSKSVVQPPRPDYALLVQSGVKNQYR